MKKQKIIVPDTERLLTRYISVGCPVREGWLYDVYPSPKGKPWVVLYTSPEADAEWDHFAEHGRLIAEARSRGAQYTRRYYPAIDLGIFEFETVDAALWLTGEALGRLGQRVPCPTKTADVYGLLRSMAEERVRERAELERKAREKSEPNPNIHRFFDFEPA